jgi:hypothetical protein
MHFYLFVLIINKYSGQKIFRDLSEVPKIFRDSKIFFKNEVDWQEPLDSLES